MARAKGGLKKVGRSSPLVANHQRIVSALHIFMQNMSSDDYLNNHHIFR
jgi:hypothetical protein